MNRINCILVAIAPVVMSRGVDGQVYSATTSVGQKIRIQAETTWTVFKNGDSTRSILNGDTLVESAKTAGTTSTVAWLLGPDSAKVLRYEGSAPAHMTSPTFYVMRNWEIARNYRLVNTGVDGATYPYNSPSITTRILGDTVWMERSNGDTYRSVLHGDTLRVVRQKAGKGAREETWLIRGDSAAMVDQAGKILRSAPKRIVLITRELAEIQQRNPVVRP